MQSSHGARKHEMLLENETQVMLGLNSGESIK